MELTLAIKHIYPTLESGTDFLVLDDNQGEGPYIQWYNTEITQPTESELNTAWTNCCNETEITTKLRRLEELNRQILEYGGSNALVGFERFDTIRTAKLAELNAEVATIKADLDTNYETTIVDDIITSIFG